MSTNRISKAAGWANVKKLDRGPNGRPLCRQCSTEVGKGRRTFCSDACVDQWRIKTDPGYCRRLVFRRDKGICAACGVDTEQQFRKAISLPYREREAYKESIKAQGRCMTFWDMDHRVEVVNGGGECGLDNYQTLCIACHKAKTKRLAQERAAARKLAKLAEKEP